MNEPSPETHARFLASLDESQDAVWLVARWLSTRGHRVDVPPIAKAPTHADWKQYADGGDLYLSQRVEVKRLSRAFTGPHDWPFGRHYIVCAKHSFDRAMPKPYAYVHVSADNDHAGIVLGADRPHWRIESRTDSRYNRTQELYLSPIERVHWVSGLKSRRGE